MPTERVLDADPLREGKTRERSRAHFWIATALRASRRRLDQRFPKAKRDRKYICSNLVYDCFDQIGVPFSLHDEYVSLDEIWLDDQVQLQYRIM